MRVSMGRVNKEISWWHRCTFPRATKTEQWLKLLEETWEWLLSGFSMAELADIYIVCAVLAKRWHSRVGLFVCKALYNKEGMIEAVARKMICNVDRKWTKKGKVHHQVEKKR